MRRFFYMVFVGAFAVAAQAADTQRGGQIRPHTGEVSNDVAVERLRTLGYKDIRVMAREGHAIILEASADGKPTRLKTDQLRGKVTDIAYPQRTLIEPLQSMRHFYIEREQVPVIRNEALVPIKPLSR